MHTNTRLYTPEATPRRARRAAIADGDSGPSRGEIWDEDGRSSERSIHGQQAGDWRQQRHGWSMIELCKNRGGKGFDYRARPRSMIMNRIGDGWFSGTRRETDGSDERGAWRTREGRYDGRRGRTTEETFQRWEIKSGTEMTIITKEKHGE